MQLTRDECDRNYCLSRDAFNSHAPSISDDYINLFCESKIVKLLKKLSESIGVTRFPEKSHLTIQEPSDIYLFQVRIKLVSLLVAAVDK